MSLRARVRQILMENDSNEPGVYFGGVGPRAKTEWDTCRSKYKSAKTAAKHYDKTSKKCLDTWKKFFAHYRAAPYKYPAKQIGEMWAQAKADMGLQTKPKAPKLKLDIKIKKPAEPVMEFEEPEYEEDEYVSRQPLALEWFGETPKREVLERMVPSSLRSMSDEEFTVIRPRRIEEPEESLSDDEFQMLHAVLSKLKSSTKQEGLRNDIEAVLMNMRGGAALDLKLVNKLVKRKGFKKQYDALVKKIIEKQMKSARKRMKKAKKPAKKGGCMNCANCMCDN